MVTRRLLGGLAAASVFGWMATRFMASPVKAREKGPFEINKTPDEWRKILTPKQFYVLREEGTERAFTSPLDKVYDPGLYNCAGCDLPLFSSVHKFDSRTGWPSFWQPLDNAIGESVDYFLGYARREVHCRRCGGHQGHVFPDGPKPTGLRYCINGVALKFVPGKTNLEG